MPSNGSKTTNEYSDQHHLFPTNQIEANAVRNNHPLGEVTTVTSSYLLCSYGKNANNQNVFEPKEGHKGDAARALLYMCVRYNGVNGNDWTFNTLNTATLPGLGEAPQDLATLLQWHLQDPPDKWEVERNDYIESIQKNRNPFVDHPEYVNYINFNDVTKQSPVYLDEPTNFLTNLTATLNGDKTEITLNWTDALTGTITPQGYLIVAYDKDTYFIPVDGSTYSSDTNLGDGKAIVYIDYSANNNYTFTALNPAKQYYFTVYSYNGTGTSINYKIGGATPQANTILPVDEPSNYPSNLTISSPHYTGFTVNWDDATGTNLPDGYLILVNKTGTFENPTDGTTYNSYVNAELGEAVVNVSYDNVNYYTLNGLRENTNYYIKVFSYAGSGSLINYKTNGTPPTASTTSLSIPEPTNYPINITINEITATGFKVNWDEATGTTLPDGYWIMINTTGNFTAPIDGDATEDDTELDDGSGVVHVDYTDNNNYTFTGLSSSTTYYTKMFSYCGDNFRRNYKSGETAPAANGTTTSLSTYPVSLLDDFNRANSGSLGNSALGI
nr:endonuclease [Melioribacteraceae bacterium]